jgi:uncharacterized protein related to proFAR isomerase
LHGFKLEITTKTGLPQGGVCSAKFWAIAYNEAVEILNRNGVRGTVYADDSSALASGRNYGDIIRKLQRVVDELVDWGRGCGLRFNPSKTVVVAFTG